MAKISEAKYPCSRKGCLVPIKGGTLITELGFVREEPFAMYHKECAPPNAEFVDPLPKKEKQPK